QPAGSVPGGQVFWPSLIVQHIAVQPDPQSASGPQSDAYAVPGLRMYRHGLTASAEPMTAVFTRKLRRDWRRPRRFDTRLTTFSATVIARPPRRRAMC